MIQYLVYSAVFVAILLAVEGIYLLAFASNARERAVNRRMQVAKSRETVAIAPSLLREKFLGGSVSRQLLRWFPSLEQDFWAAGLTTTPAKALGACVGVFALLTLLLSFVPGLPLLVQLGFAGMLAFGLPLLALSVAVGRQKRKFDEQLPDAINLITRGLQAGHPVPVAFGLVAKEMPDPIGSQFGVALDEMNFGRDRGQSLRDIGKRFPTPEFMFFIAAIEMQRESGGNLVGILDNLVKTMRERANLKKKAFAMSAEGRLTAIIVGSLPYLLLLFFMLTNPSFILDQTSNPLFWPLMIGAWIMWLIGIIMIWRMVNIKV
jgi:tight adherence protein B